MGKSVSDSQVRPFMSVSATQVMMDCKTPLKLCQYFLTIFHYPTPNSLNTSAVFLKIWQTKRVLQAYLVSDSMDE